MHCRDEQLLGGAKNIACVFLSALLFPMLTGLRLDLGAAKESLKSVGKLTSLLVGMQNVVRGKLGEMDLLRQCACVLTRPLS